MRISVKHDRIEFFEANNDQPPPEIFGLVGLTKTGRFNAEQYGLVPEVPNKYCCRVNRGIYAVFGRIDTFICLLPERVRLTPAVARELLRKKQLPPPRKLNAKIAIALTDLIANGASWAVATSLLGVGTNGHTAKEELEKEGEP